MEQRGASLRELHKIAQQAGVPVDLSRILRGRVPPPNEVAPLLAVLQLPAEEVAHLLEVSKQHWAQRDRKSTRLNSSHGSSSYAVIYLKKKSEDTPGAWWRYVYRNSCYAGSELSLI